MPFAPHWMLHMTFLLGTCHFCDSGGVSSLWKILTLEEPWKASKAVLQGEVPPVFRLMKRKVDDITEEEEQQAEVSVRPADVDTPVEGDLAEDRVLHDCRRAAEWVEANKPLLSARVDLPDVLSMGEERQAEAALQYGRVWKEELDEDEKETILEPFKFTFYDIDDMWKFCKAIMDQTLWLPYFFKIHVGLVKTHSVMACCFHSAADCTMKVVLLRISWEKLSVPFLI
ncbi:uncharacterized protein LOC115578343 [Sparus aurata]|uniref:uncharacterized protein LOC115578343 n=1 Tax=Sparus aurata TaxID=8175 RepID=UPI0011C0D1D2|nr:uncharacterized protein LOC115578343 [Sparus aurata]